MAVLSIQSHVVYGYAGNSAAVFPLQRLGREVWAVNTVEFSNHTGYGAWRGVVLGAQLANDLVLGLEERGVLPRCKAVLSGYLGDAEVAKAIIEAVKKVRYASPNAIYCCDPVMGDYGRGIYVKPGIPEMIKNELVPLADIICPNKFELEILTGIPVNNIDDAAKAINTLHEMGPSIVLVTSYKEKDGELGMIVSDKKNMFMATTSELPLGDGVAGTGDMTTAVFLSRYLETKDLEKALFHCTASVFGILKASYDAHVKEQGAENAKTKFELKIIDAQDQLISPLQTFNTVKIK